MSRTTKKPADRIDPLAVLPVFWKLDGKQVLLIGEGNGADWKAELLGAAGAEVIRQLAWDQGDFTGKALALADCDTDDEAAAFYHAAIAAGVPVNVIDKPKYCQFQFGGIVNRSPVIVSISTNGAAPILGQAIRRRIETLLPKSLETWAKFSQAIRPGVLKRLAPGAERRTFWEDLSQRAFGHAPDAAYKKQLNRQLLSIGDPAADKTGKVTLVGAGPGDAELLTLKAVRALQGADVILFDDLVGDDVLELARREAKRFMVGKRAGQRSSCRQDDINAMMIKFARAGKTVVRLKGGDPMIFGRGGEEIAALEAQGIQVDVVPGVTTALALGAALGVSLTHRDHAQSVRFVTAHARNGELPTSVDWKAIASEPTTSVFYMGARMAGRIQVKLLGQGMAPSTPIVVARNVSRPNQTIEHATLSELAALASKDIRSPTLIAIGEALAVKDTLATQPTPLPPAIECYEAA